MKRRSVLASLAASAAGGRAAAQEARQLGAGRRAYGGRSPEVHATRFFGDSPTPGTGASRTPLQDTVGVITPSSLHFERHHSGVPRIEAARHELLVHGLAGRSVAFSMEDLRRLPSVSRVHFIECAGNSGREHAGNPGETAQKSHGLVSGSEWTGVRLSTLLRIAGVQGQAQWVVAEGADAARHSRSIPIAKAMDDVIVAYAQNGEPVRPEQGYPLRLVVPGWEGNVHVKWLHRLQLTAGPAMSRDEAASYTDLMPDGRAWQFSFEMDVKSVILRPSGGHALSGPGFHEISGIAWSGRGRVKRVDVSVDGGRTWQPAALQPPVLDRSLTRFTLPWAWDGRDTWIMSRATDETGDEQPTRDRIVAMRGTRPGPDGFNHYNGIKAWHVTSGGQVTHV
ncbi:sulfite dehydrogenase [Ramlibacter algicola]|uniref:Sulfite dehydrogenase n=1 Tax=Ramlibacter algicola TaxID=2795217 RepID=A0A934Q671_9BURK|nr:sulfite dehydrogenase [Ramlibacter algicola]MBK0394917.1 sulfite dehydrogenase [Ramlibacter algicola]